MISLNCSGFFVTEHKTPWLLWIVVNRRAYFSQNVLHWILQIDAFLSLSQARIVEFSFQLACHYETLLDCNGVWRWFVHDFTLHLQDEINMKNRLSVSLCVPYVSVDKTSISLYSRREIHCPWSGCHGFERQSGRGGSRATSIWVVHESKRSFNATQMCCFVETNFVYVALTQNNPMLTNELGFDGDWLCCFHLVSYPSGCDEQRFPVNMIVFTLERRPYHPLLGEEDKQLQQTVDCILCLWWQLNLQRNAFSGDFMMTIEYAVEYFLWWFYDRNWVCRGIHFLVILWWQLSIQWNTFYGDFMIEIEYVVEYILWWFYNGNWVWCGIPLWCFVITIEFVLEFILRWFYNDNWICSRVHWWWVYDDNSVCCRIHSLMFLRWQLSTQWNVLWGDFMITFEYAAAEGCILCWFYSYWICILIYFVMILWW